MSEEDLKKKFIEEFQAKVAAHLKVMRAARAAEFAARKKENRKLSVALYRLKGDMWRLAQAQKRTQENLKRLGNVRRRLDGNGPAASPS